MYIRTVISVLRIRWCHSSKPSVELPFVTASRRLFADGEYLFDRLARALVL